MKKTLILAAAALALAACTKPAGPETPGGNPDTPGDGELSAPAVTFSAVTTSSFTAQWSAVEGADEYRYEVTTMVGSQNDIVAIEVTQNTSFSLEALSPGTEYKVRVAARADGATSRNWYEGMVKTEGTSQAALTLVPVEKYIAGYVYPVAKVTASDENIYYWVSAVPTDRIDEAAEWIQEDIDDNYSYYGGWDGLLEKGLIMQGTGESVGFNFQGYGSFRFVAAAVSSTMSGISVSPELFYSREFYAVAVDEQLSFPAAKEDFLGDWVLTTSGTLHSVDGMFQTDRGEFFDVTISDAGDGTLRLKGWGGERSRFSEYPVSLDFTQDGDYGGFHINLPQTITTEEGIEWKYYAWYTFYGGASDIEYGPYDPSEYEDLPLDDAFSGFAGNMNGTVVKIFGRQVTGTDGLGILISALWPYGGEDADGKGIYLNGIHEEPLELYYLVRKDVAEGALLEIPDSSSEKETSLSTKSSSASYSRILR